MWQDFKNLYHLGMAFLANLWFGFPSHHLTVIGVTGTDGKTTTVSLIYHILKKSGENASMISSVGAVILGKNYDVGFHVTTPSPFALQRFLKRAVDKAGGKKNFLVLETTSHALDQYRVFGVKFTVGVVTNITHEHLDYHKTYKNYVTTKAKLLKMSKIAIVNRDDESYDSILKIKNKISKIHMKNKKWITYGLAKNADVNPKNFSFKTELIGEFNQYNILAASAACKALGLKDGEIKRGIASFQPPLGREEIVYKKDFIVMVDFAHTPNAFKMILQAVRPKTSGRLIHVFGSAGLRDVEKRPLMGKASSKYADIIILTAEDPRAESVEKINREIASGIKNKTLLRIDDRKKAIEAAIKMAKKGDLVLITGKSHEKSINYGHGEEPWDEFLAVKKALKLCRE